MCGPLSIHSLDFSLQPDWKEGLGDFLFLTAKAEKPSDGI
jgi:hypothetical protein